MRHRYRIVSATLLTILLTACSEPEPAEYRIGVLAAASGDYWNTSGAPTVQGARLAINQINEAGGIVLDGRVHMLRLVVGEHEPRGDHATAIARLLLNRDSVHALVGPQMSASAIPVADVAEAAQVPMITPMSSNAKTTADKRFVFRLAFLDDLQGEVLAEFAAEEFQAQTGAVLFDEALEYSSGLAARFEEAFRNVGGTIVASEAYTTDRAETFLEQLTRIAEADPDVLFLPNLTTADSIQMFEARALGIQARFIGSDSWDLRRLSALPEAEGTLVTHQWHYEAPTPKAEAFLSLVDSIFGETPRTTTAMTYDAVQVLAEALRSAGTGNPDRVAEAIAGVEGYLGVTGTISFRGRQDPERSVVVSKVTDGRVEIIAQVDPKPGT